MARHKVVPPVTPRIVQVDPGQRLTRYGLLVGIFLLAVWFSYDYGRSQAPANGDAPVAQAGQSEHRIPELEQERDTLKLQVAELKQRMKQANRTIAAERIRRQSPEQSVSPQQKVPAPEAVATLSEPADNTLKLENMHIDRTESENMFRIGFSVLHTGDSTGRVTGSIWIAVNGFSNGDPKRLSFKALSPDRRLIVKMGFDQQQDVMEDIVLPEGFRPKNIMIEAKPYGDKYTGTATKIIWQTTP